MKEFILKFLCLVVMATVVYSCSEPEGGYKPPTPTEVVGYSKHVVIGEVTEIIRPDPAFGTMYGDETYGAMVTVQCTYKGGPISGRIRIGGAGNVPGMCTSKPLDVGRHYILFLDAKDTTKDMYEQVEPAVPKTSLDNYLSVCGIEMVYPQENGITLKRRVCPEALPCKRDTQTGKTSGDPNKSPPTQGDPNSSGTANKSKGGDGNGATMVTATSGAGILFSVLCLLML